MRFVRFEIELENLAWLRLRVRRRNLRVKQSPFGNLNGLIHKLGVFGFLDLVAIDDQRSAIGSNGLRRGRVGLLEHFRLHDFSVDPGPCSNPCAGQFKLPRRFFGIDKSAVDRHAVQIAFPRPHAADLVSKDERIATAMPLVERSALKARLAGDFPVQVANEEPGLVGYKHMVWFAGSSGASLKSMPFLLVFEVWSLSTR